MREFPSEAKMGRKQKVRGES